MVEFASTEHEKSGQFEPVDGPCRRQTLGKGVRFSPPRIESSRPAQAKESDSVVEFEPSGQADAAVLEVTDGSVLYSVIVVPESGRAILVSGKVQQLPNDRQDLDAQS